MQVVLLNPGLFKERPLPQRAGGILTPQKFPLRHGIVEQFRIVETAPFTGKQIGHGGSFEAARQRRIDRLADAIEEHLDMAALDRILAEGALR